MSLLTNREVILVKVESSYNTDPTAAGTDAVLVEEPSWSLAGHRAIERIPVRSSIGALRQLNGGTLIALTFTTEVKGSGTAGTAPETDALFRACGMGVTNVPATSDTYAPVSTGHESVWVEYYQDGILMTVGGCRGNFSMALEAGNVGKITWTLTGHLQSDPSDTALASPTYDSTVPGVIIGTSFTVDSDNSVISSLAMDMSNTIATPPSLAAADGYGEVRITRRDVQGSFDPETELVATKDYYAEFSGSEALALATGTIGSAGNQYAVTMPAISYRGIGPGDRDGVRTYEIPYGAAESSGDDEVSIAFT